MGSFTITLDLPQPPAVLFRYLADPRNVAWRDYLFLPAS